MRFNTVFLLFLLVALPVNVTAEISAETFEDDTVGTRPTADFYTPDFGNEASHAPNYVASDQSVTAPNSWKRHAGFIGFKMTNGWDLYEAHNGESSGFNMNVRTAGHGSFGWAIYGRQTGSFNCGIAQPARPGDSVCLDISGSGGGIVFFYVYNGGGRGSGQPRDAANNALVWEVNKWYNVNIVRHLKNPFDGSSCACAEATIVDLATGASYTVKVNGGVAAHASPVNNVYVAPRTFAGDFGPVWVDDFNVYDGQDALAVPSSSVSVPGLVGFSLDETGAHAAVRSAGGANVQVLNGGTLTFGATTAATNCNRLDGVMAFFSPVRGRTYIAYLQCESGTPSNVQEIRIRTEILEEPDRGELCESGNFCEVNLEDGELASDEDKLHQIGALSTFPIDYTRTVDGPLYYDSAHMAWAFTTLDGKLGVVSYVHNNNLDDKSDMATVAINPSGGFAELLCTTRNLKDGRDLVYAGSLSSDVKGYAIQYSPGVLPSFEAYLEVALQPVLPGAPENSAPRAIGCGNDQILIARNNGEIRITNLSTGRTIIPVKDPAGLVTVNAAGIDPQGRVAVWIRAGKIQVYDLIHERWFGNLTAPTLGVVHSLHLNNFGKDLFIPFKSVNQRVERYDLGVLTGSENFTYNPAADSDGDGIPNTRDPDIDGDGIANAADPDVDGDGEPNTTDVDDDGDGAPDTVDGSPSGSVRPQNAAPGPAADRQLLYFCIFTVVGGLLGFFLSGGRIRRRDGGMPDIIPPSKPIMAAGAYGGMWVAVIVKAPDYVFIPSFIAVVALAVIIWGRR